MMAVVLRPAIADDFDKGLTDYNRGDYATTHAVWRPLVEQGHARPNTMLG